MNTPTPTPGVMRAADKIDDLVADYVEIDDAIIVGHAKAKIAAIITEETGVAELLQMLEEVINLAAYAMKEANRDCGEFDRDEELKEARALLAKHTTPPHRPGEGKV